VSKPAPIEPTYTIALQERIVSWLIAHPGPHRARDIAMALGCPPAVDTSAWVQRVGNLLGKFARVDYPANATARISRVDIQLPGWKRPTGHYQHVPPEPVTEPEVTPPAAVEPETAEV
jgi:hypothetical protein